MISPATYLKLLINCYPPYWATGIVVKEIAQDFTRIRVEMGMHWYNRNYVKTHFGGSLYAMTDPFYMLMLIKLLGKEYTVWDKSAKIEFLKASKDRVFANFVISPQQVAEIKALAEDGRRVLYDLGVDVVDKTGVMIAKGIKTLYIKKKI